MESINSSNSIRDRTPWICKKRGLSSSRVYSNYKWAKREITVERSINMGPFKELKCLLMELEEVGTLKWWIKWWWLLRVKYLKDKQLCQWRLEEALAQTINTMRLPRCYKMLNNNNLTMETNNNSSMLLRSLKHRSHNIKEAVAHLLWCLNLRHHTLLVLLEIWWIRQLQVKTWWLLGHPQTFIPDLQRKANL